MQLSRRNSKGNFVLILEVNLLADYYYQPPRPPKSKSNKISESGNSVSRKKSQTSKKEEVVNSFDQLEGNKLDRPPIRAHRILPQSIEDPPELKFAKQPGQDRFKAVIENKDDEEVLDELESSPAPSPPIRAIIKKQIKKKSTPAIEPVNSSSNSPSPPPKKLKAPRSKAPVIDSTIQNNFNLDPLGSDLFHFQ